MATEPRTTMMTKLYHASAKTGEHKQIAFVQSIPEFLTAPEPITWSALDINDERQAEGRKKAENLEIELIFTEEQYDELKALETAKSNEYWFIQLPEETAETAGKPLTWNFQATVHVGLSELALDDMIKAKITLYRIQRLKKAKAFPQPSSTKMSARSRTKPETSTEENIEETVEETENLEEE